MSQGTLRSLTALVGIPALLATVYIGSYWFGLLVGLIALMAAFEMGKLLDSTDAAPLMIPGLVLSTLVLARLWLPHWEAVATLVSLLQE